MNTYTHTGIHIGVLNLSSRGVGRGGAQGAQAPPLSARSSTYRRMTKHAFVLYIELTFLLFVSLEASKSCF